MSLAVEAPRDSCRRTLDKLRRRTASRWPLRLRNAPTKAMKSKRPTPCTLVVRVVANPITGPRVPIGGSDRGRGGRRVAQRGFVWKPNTATSGGAGVLRAPQPTDSSAPSLTTPLELPTTCISQPSHTLQLRPGEKGEGRRAIVPLPGHGSAPAPLPRLGAPVLRTPKMRILGLRFPSLSRSLALALSLTFSHSFSRTISDSLARQKYSASRRHRRSHSLSFSLSSSMPPTLSPDPPSSPPRGADSLAQRSARPRVVNCPRKRTFSPSSPSSPSTPFPSPPLTPPDPSPA